ncbi:MAG: hypothetical protein WCF44_15645 [Candidatus Methylophosphatis roskildensis]
MLFLISSVKLIAEIASMALAGQLLLGLLAGAQRDSNLFYQLLQVITNPVLKGVRVLTPRVVLDRHIPLAAFGLMAVVWLLATIGKIDLCVRIGVQQCL